MPTLLKKHWKLLIIVVVLLMVSFLIYHQFVQGGAIKTETAQVKRGTLEQVLTISGTIQAQEQANLQFQTTGQLAWVGVKVGDHVNKNQLIASLDSSQLQKTLQKYLAAYSKNRNSFDQTQDAYKDQILSDSIKRTLANSQSDLSSSVLDVELQSLAIQFANLTTPIAGVVTRVDTPVAGINITLPSQAVFTVVSPDSLYFSASADQTEVTSLQVGQSGNLVLDSYPNQTLLGQVKAISLAPIPGESSTVYEVKFILPENGLKTNQYRLGMTGDLTFTTAHKENVLKLPLKFVKTEGDKKYVLQKVGSGTKKTFVQTGLETDTDTEIKSGLTEGQTVVNLK